MDDETKVIDGLGGLLHEARDLVDEQGKPDIVTIKTPEGVEAVGYLDHQGLTILDPEQFDGWRAQPFALSGSVTIATLDSLIGYTDRHKDEGSVLFADDNRERPTITAVLDYHRKGSTQESARFSRHKATYPLPLSDEWKAWHELDKQSLSMADFARFLEDHIVDVMPVDMTAFSDEQDAFIRAVGGRSKIANPAKLMELATGLQVFEEGQVSQATKLQSGESQITVESRHVDGQGGELIIPSLFVIGIPVFRLGERYQIVVRLRYRKTGSGILFFYELWRDDRVFDHAFNEAVVKVADATGLPVFYGRP